MPAKKKPKAKAAPKLGFISYSRKDLRRCDELREHLSQLRREQIIEDWHDGMIDQRKPWETDLKAKLEAADIILLLVSARFLSSYYCCEVEVTAAIKRWEKKQTIILPILIGHCDYKTSDFAKLNVFNYNGGPIQGNRDRRDAGWTEVAKKVRSLLAG